MQRLGGDSVGDDHLVVRYFAAARAATGVNEEKVGTGPDGLDLNALTAVLAERHGERLATVLTVASFLVDGLTWHDRRAVLPAGVTIDILPPFAGG